MNTEIRTVHFTMHDSTREYLDKKLERIAYAKDLVTDLLFVFTKEKIFKAECTINFRWGSQAHLLEEDFELNESIDKLMDKVEHKISKEKEKVQEKK
jgi:putative sigma-54 modulation protein